MNTIKFEDDLVSIITPMFNCEKYIHDMIDSVINQSYKRWELIIIDDCSTDKSIDIVKKYCDLDSRIRLIKLIKNSGPAIARNTGIDKSKGRFIAFLDSDDLWHKDKLQIQLKAMREEKCKVSCTSYEIVEESTKKVIKEFKVPERITYKDMLRRNYFSCDTVIVDRAYINDIKMESYYRHEDYITWLKIIKQSNYALGIHENLAKYRIGKNTRSSNKLSNIKPQFEIYYKIEKLGLIKSIYYTTSVCILSLIKYSFRFTIKKQ